MSTISGIVMTQQDSVPAIATAPNCLGGSQEAVVYDALMGLAANSTGSTAAMRILEKKDPVRFAYAAARLLGSAEMSHGLKIVAHFVSLEGLIADVLLLSDEIPLAEAVAAARRIMDAESNFDIRMTRRIFQEFGEADHVPPLVALRLLHILDQVSSRSSKLTPQLIRFVRHSSKEVRSKSVLLVGRGNLNLKRTMEFLASPEARVRANAVESLWAHPDGDTQKILSVWSKDPSPRVMVNALVGLCRLGDLNAPGRLIALADSEDPAIRAGAAWGMGHADRADAIAGFKAALESLAGDSEPKVQKMARTSLDRLSPVTVAEPIGPVSPSC